MPDSLTAAELADHLEESLEAVLSARRTAEPLAQALAEFSRAQQEFVLHWVNVVVKTNSEMGYQFAAYVSEALKLMEVAGVEEWLIRAMDVYDRQGLYPGCAALKDFASFADQLAERDVSVSFHEVATVLDHFVAGLSGRRLKLAVDEKHVWTDTETLYLPERVADMPSRKQNFQLYKAMVSYLWAQLWFGTFRRTSDGRGLVSTYAEYPEPDKALTLFQNLEAVRLTAAIGRDLAGLHREMLALQQTAGEVQYTAEWQSVLNRLRDPQATVNDTYESLRTVYQLGTVPDAFCFQGQIQPGRAEAAMQERMNRERRALRRGLSDLHEELSDTRNGREATDKFSVRMTRDDFNNELKVGLELDGKAVAPPESVKGLLQSVLQDLGEIPEEYLVPAGDGEHKADGRKRAEDMWEGTYPEDGAYLYNEWDYRRQHYRKDWCVLREIDVHPHNGSFVEDTLERYGGLVAELRRTFEVLRGEDRLLKKQKDGDDLDLDAIVEAFADARAGREMTDRLLTRLNKSERDVAVVFMVDMSGSTKGWINEAEKESLVLLCEALEILGDRYAIYGFSGLTRKRCELYRVKAFTDPYDELVRSRIAGIKPQDYTRMGVVIRHLTQMFRQVEARTKLLVTLSDGRPDDYDGYRGEYGIEDTRQALIEAKHEGIHPFCITIDNEARDYLPHMYGAVNYVLVDQVLKLPFKVSDIYRQLTT